MKPRCNMQYLKCSQIWTSLFFLGILRVISVRPTFNWDLWSYLSIPTSGKKKLWLEWSPTPNLLGFFGIFAPLLELHPSGAPCTSAVSWRKSPHCLVWRRIVGSGVDETPSSEQASVEMVHILKWFENSDFTHHKWVLKPNFFQHTHKHYLYK